MFTVTAKIKYILLCAFFIGAFAYATHTVSAQTFTQQDYRWYENVNDITPTTPLAATNTAASISATTSPLRLRANVTVTSDPLATSSQAFKLQYSHATTSGWADVGTWWDTSFSNRRTVTFDNASSSEVFTDFPVLVLLNATNSNNIDYSKTQNSGQDIRFIDSDDATELQYEIDHWDEAATSSVWVKIPSLATGSADFIYMYYGSTSAVSTATTTGVWDSNFRLVSHFGSTDASATDSTQNINHGTVAGATATTSNGIAGYAKNFDGANDKINYGSASSLDNATTLTYSLWMRRAATTSSQYLAGKDRGGVLWLFLPEVMVLLNLNVHGAALLAFGELGMWGIRTYTI